MEEPGVIEIINKIIDTLLYIMIGVTIMIMFYITRNKKKFTMKDYNIEKDIVPCKECGHTKGIVIPTNPTRAECSICQHLTDVKTTHNV
tara:strand:+ start:5857 stop:6123 length:267 start_codon:yes stop_codon:yes gene_type:complete